MIRTGTAAVLVALVLPAVAGGAVTGGAVAAAAPGKPSAADPAPDPHGPGGPRVVNESIDLPIFGRSQVYRPEPIQRARGVILFVSGDGGWNQGVVDMARRSASSALVVGLSMPVWQKAAEKNPNRCWYPAGELESIAQGVEKLYRLPRYLRPILVGYSSGATVVYAALAQAPGETFAGAVSLGFCPDLELDRPVCGAGAWKPSFDRKKRRSDLPRKTGLLARQDGTPRWTALQGSADKVCDPEATASFVEGLPASRIVKLPKVGHGFSVPRNWGSAFDAAVASLLEPVAVWEPEPSRARSGEDHQSGGTARSESRSSPSPGAREEALLSLDLPLQVLWPDGAREVLIFVSGDGGWAELDRKVSEDLSSHEAAVVGWNTLRYFWSAKSPEVFLTDLERVVDALPSDLPVFAGGYSFGAEVVAAALARLPGKTPPASSPAPAIDTRDRAASLSRIAGLVLIGPGPYATFEVSPLDWLRSTEAPTQHSVRAALESRTGTPVLCLEAEEHDGSGCPEGAVPGLVQIVLPGGHHFAGDYEGIAKKILEFMSNQAGSPRRESPER